MSNLTAFLRDVFSRLPRVLSVKVERRGAAYIVYVSVPYGADQKTIWGVHKAILTKRPDLSIDLFVEEDF